MNAEELFCGQVVTFAPPIEWVEERSTRIKGIYAKYFLLELVINYFILNNYLSAAEQVGWLWLVRNVFELKKLSFQSFLSVWWSRSLILGRLSGPHYCNSSVSFSDLSLEYEDLKEDGNWRMQYQIFCFYLEYEDLKAKRRKKRYRLGPSSSRLTNKKAIYRRVLSQFTANGSCIIVKSRSNGPSHGA